MATQPNNPFVLPGFGQPGELGQNPLLASMEMMRQAWQNLAGLGGFDTSMMSAALSPEDLERRISDLRAVENWLRMNLSMLSSTIQGMEVQRATVTTLRSFVESAKSTTTTPEGVSPLEAVLGIRRGQPEPKEQASSAASPPPWAGASPSPWAGAPASGTPGGAAGAAPQGPADASAQNTPPPSNESQAQPDATGQNTENAMAGATAAAQGWWNMLQQQFDNLAAATSATLQGAEAMKAGFADMAPGTAAPAEKPARKTAPRKTAARKTATRKAAATAPSRKTPAKTAAKKAAKKASSPTASRARKTTAKPAGRTR